MYEQIDDICEKSNYGIFAIFCNIGHDMEIKIRTIEDVRLDDNMEHLLVRVVCRNCNLVAWERFKSFDLVQEVK